MTEHFDALVISKNDKDRLQSVAWTSLTLDDLMEGDVTVRVRHTTMNYKDALAITGKSPVVRRYPMIPGIDFAGEVVQSGNPEFSPGDEVILNGWGVGETHMGGYSRYARVKGEWLLKTPEGLSGAECMAVGTAGYTAALCVERLRALGVTPDRGKILVTGAVGGVGSFAIALLAQLGYSVSASTGRPDESAYLTDLGASEIIDRAEFSEKGRPLGKERFGGAVDSVGSHTLANVIAQIGYGGTVAACGLAQGFDLPTTVMPFILRGVTLAGVDSVMAPREARLKAWSLVSSTIDRTILEKITHTAKLDDVTDFADDMLAGKIRGRLLLSVE